MVEFKDNNITVMCNHCKEHTEDSVKMYYNNTITEDNRSFGTEYMYVFNGEQKCSICEASLKIEAIVHEYPKGIVSYIRKHSENCIIIGDNFTKDDINIIK